jgi:hypothetical protein
MNWRIGREYCRRSPEANKADFREIVKKGPAPGLLAFEGDLAVGWCQITPRSAIYQALLLPRQDAGELPQKTYQTVGWVVGWKCVIKLRFLREV